MSKDNPKKTGAKKSVAKSKLPPGFIVVVIAIIAGGLVAVIIAGVLTHRGGDSGVKPPDFAYGPTTPKDAAKAYQFAIDHPDILAQIPCYCGCGQEAGHTSNLDCFIKSRSGNDVTFDDHASY